MSAASGRDEALADSGETARYHGLLERVTEAILIADADGKYVGANRAATELLGYLPEELREMAVADVVAAGRDWTEAEYARFVRDGHWRGELQVRRKDGTRVRVEAAATAVELPTGTVWLSVLRDVSERTWAERRSAFLAEASALLAGSLDYETTLARVARLAVPELADLCVVDVLEEDRSIHRMAAHVEPAKEAAVRELLHRFPPDPEGPHPVMRVLRTGEPEVYLEFPDPVLQAAAFNEEHLAILRGMGYRSAMYLPLVARGQTLGVMTLIMADSGRRYDPNDLALAEDLAGRIALAVDNARLYREAREAIRARDEFLSIVSHDLKNPLASVKGFAQLLSRQLARANIPNSGRVFEGLAQIDATVTRMVALINELQDVAQVQMGRLLELDRRPADLVALAREVAAAHQQTTDRHRIRVEAAVPELVGAWDATRLERVLANLVSNAIKFSPAGGEVTLTVAPDGDDWAELVVRDRGVGIPAADLPRIFERFHRGQNVAGWTGGSGIGLASAGRIVEQHGGTITVASEEGKGSAFAVRLPVGSRQWAVGS